MNVTHNRCQHPCSRVDCGAQCCRSSLHNATVCECPKHADDAEGRLALHDDKLNTSCETAEAAAEALEKLLEYAEDPRLSDDARATACEVARLQASTMITRMADAVDLRIARVHFAAEVARMKK